MRSSKTIFKVSYYNVETDTFYCMFLQASDRITAWEIAETINEYDKCYSVDNVKKPSDYDLLNTIGFNNKSLVQKLAS